MEIIRNPRPQPKKRVFADVKIGEAFAFDPGFGGVNIKTGVSEVVVLGGSASALAGARIINVGLGNPVQDAEFVVTEKREVDIHDAPDSPLLDGE